MLNGIRPWGTIAGISSDASFLKVSNPHSEHYTIFRTKVSAVKVSDPASVPEPGSVIGLVAFGALSAGPIMKRKSKLA